MIFTMNTNNTDPIDALSSFREEIAPQHLPYFLESPLAQKIGWRFVGLVGLNAWRAGKITLSESLSNFLPAKYKNEKTKQVIWAYVDGKLEHVFQSRKLYERGAISLFGRPFSPINPSLFREWFALFKTLAEAIVTDQYHARELIKRDSIVIDGGAFIGAFSMFAATLAPEGHVYSFEPTLATYMVLQKNAAGYSNITTIHRALGSKSEEKELIINPDVPAANTLCDSGMMSETTPTSFKNKENIRITTIDEFVKTHSISRVDFIKLDTEGYEARILEGAKETIRTYKPAMAMSSYHHCGDAASLPAVITAICPDYKWKLNKGLEEDLLFWV
jgi:FkbM family methyltransferase